MDMRWLNKGLIVLATGAVVGLLVTGCGGGGSGGGNTATVISGTAAAGAPIVGYVSVSDSSANLQPVLKGIPIEANGHYSVDVTGLTPPFAFLADGTVGGKRVTLYSVATADDEGKTINITPFTDLIVRNMAAGAVDTYLANSANMANLTTTELNKQRDALTAKLAPALLAMGVSDSIDLLRATFNADSTGLDRFMDAVKVDTTNPSAVTITNIMDAASALIIDTTASSTSLVSSGSVSTTNLAPSATPIDGMLASAKEISTLFATSLPSPTNPALVALFSSTFLHNGSDSNVFLTDMTSYQPLIGMKFANLGVDSIDPTGTIAQVHVTILNSAGQILDRESPGGSWGWQMKKDAATGVWQFDGNRRVARVQVRTYAFKGACIPGISTCSAAPAYQTGLYFNINNNQQNIGKVIVKGNGLPVGGVTLTAQPNTTWMKITTANTNNCTVMCNLDYWQMSDADIAKVTPNSVYTVELYDNTATPALIDTYSESVLVAPVLNTVASTLSYPTISGMKNLAGTSAANLTPSWTVPAGLWPEMLHVYLWQSSSNASLGLMADITGTSGVTTLVATAPATGTWDSGNYTLYAADQYGGRVSTHYTPYNQVPVGGGGGPVVDTTPPTVPTSIATTQILSSRIDLAWAASSDDVGVAGYKLYSLGMLVGTSTTPSFSATNLFSGTQYCVTVTAYDAAGNESAASTSACATTAAAVMTATEQAIQSQFTVLQGLFATAIPLSSDPSLSALFDASFNDWGTNKAGFIAMLTSPNGPPVGSTMTNVVAVAARTLPASAAQIPNDATHQWFTFAFTAPAQPPELNGPWLAIYDGVSGKWLVAGSQMPAPDFVGVYTSSTPMSDGSGTTWTHVENNIVSGGLVNINHTYTSNVNSITGQFSGTGLVLATDPANSQHATFTGAGTADNFVGSVGGTSNLRAITMSGELWVKNDGSIEMYWTAVDPLGGSIGGCSSTLGVGCSPAPLP